ncbi:hypothetical protein ACR9H3_06095 [Enterobacter ludwigii]
MFDLSNLKPQFPVYDFNFTFELIDGFIIHTETSIAKSIEEYKTNGAEEFEIEISAEENIFQYIETYMGLDSASVDLDEIFTSYFPSIVRRSSFLTIFGMLEHEIERFCNRFAEKHNSVVNLSDIAGKGFERSHTFIKRMIGLEKSTYYSNLKKITILRNSCAHNDARYQSNDGQKIREIMYLMEQHPDILVQDGSQVLFKEGALSLLVADFKGYLKEVEFALMEFEKSV